MSTTSFWQYGTPGIRWRQRRSWTPSRTRASRTGRFIPSSTPCSTRDWSMWTGKSFPRKFTAGASTRNSASRNSRRSRSRKMRSIVGRNQTCCLESSPRWWRTMFPATRSTSWNRFCRRKGGRWRSSHETDDIIWSPPSFGATSAFWPSACCPALCVYPDYGVVPDQSLVVGCGPFFLPISFHIQCRAITSFLPHWDVTRVPSGARWLCLLSADWRASAWCYIILLIGPVDQRSMIAYLCAPITPPMCKPWRRSASNVKWVAVVIVLPMWRFRLWQALSVPLFAPRMNRRSSSSCVLRPWTGHLSGRCLISCCGHLSAIFLWKPLVYMLEKDLSYLLEVPRRPMQRGFCGLPRLNTQSLGRGHPP